MLPSGYRNASVKFRSTHRGGRPRHIVRASIRGGSHREQRPDRLLRIQGNTIVLLVHDRKAADRSSVIISIAESRYLRPAIISAGFNNIQFIVAEWTVLAAIQTGGTIYSSP